jgi:thioredoxin reductase (NADPH)
VLARTSSRVTVVHRRDRFRASHVLAQRVLAHPKITVRWNASVAGFEGDVERTPRADGGGGFEESAALTHVQLADATRLEAAACFIAIGHIPNTALFRGQVLPFLFSFLVLSLQW